MSGPPSLANVTYPVIHNMGLLVELRIFNTWAGVEIDLSGEVLRAYCRSATGRNMPSIAPSSGVAVTRNVYLSGATAVFTLVGFVLNVDQSNQDHAFGHAYYIFVRCPRPRFQY
jgi:hypothetical protein